jgi:hypothetical protein
MSLNYFSPLEFRVLIKRLPTVEFTTQQAAIPNISADPITQPTRFNPVFTTPDKVNFANLDLSFIVDEDMINYREIFNWIMLAAFPENHEQHDQIKVSTDGLFSDISILITNSKKNSNLEVLYRNCFPISLGELQLDTTETDVVYPKVNVTFQYDSFIIRKLDE